MAPIGARLQRAFNTPCRRRRKHGPPGPDCHMDMTQYVDVEDPMRPSRIALAPSPASLNISVMKGRRGRVTFPLLAQCRTAVVRSNQVPAHDAHARRIAHAAACS